MLGWLDASALDRIEKLFQLAGLPVRGPGIRPERYLELMSHDKKVVDGALRLVLLRGIGDAVISTSATSDLVLASIQARIA
jgi:3-dehydroquinate synthase